MFNGDKKLVRNCLESMQSDKIVTSLKCRIGLGKELNYDFLKILLMKFLRVELILSMYMQEMQF